jgi:hypothetical protein
MRERYVHTLMYQNHGWNRRRSRTMSPVSYGPFRDEDAAREWIRQSGITRATTLMSHPAAQNVKVAHDSALPVAMEPEHAVRLQLQPRQSSM